MSPRVTRTLLWEIDRLAYHDLSFAEINRRVGTAASALGLPRPSYETVRLLVRAARERNSSPGTIEFAAGAALRVCLPQALLEYAARVPLLKLK